MSFLNESLAQAISDPGPAPTDELVVRIAVAQANSAGAPPTVTIRMGGSTTNIAGVRVADTVPALFTGDTLLVLQQGTMLVVIGRMATVGAAWIAPALTNSWVAFGGAYPAPSYRKIGGVVFLRGVAKDGVLAQSMFNLPVGYRPASQFVVPGYHGGGLGTVDILTNGNVIPSGGAGNASVVLDHIRFIAEG